MHHWVSILIIILNQSITVDFNSMGNKQNSLVIFCDIYQVICYLKCKIRYLRRCLYLQFADCVGLNNDFIMVKDPLRYLCLVTWY